MAARKRAETKTAGPNAAKSLVVVESNAKAATLQRFLGPKYKVVASVGHVRDLPANAAQIPKKLKGKSWATLAVNVDEGFRPVYIIPADRKRVIAQLRSELKNAQELLVATDEDREGEAIAWHLVEVLKPRMPVRRMVFHEITRSAVQGALEHTRDIDEHLVHAQEARRVLDRLIGYLVSPVLWKKVQSGLSAGRVQTPALRLIVDRERERMAFVRAGYWGLTTTLAPADRPDAEFAARLVSLDGQDVAGGDDFDPATGDLLAGRSVRRLGTDDARRIADALAEAPFRVGAVDKSPVTRRPAPPFITSTLQQSASGRLRFSARQTMRVAQQLYESGYITYMRTDSPALSEQAIAAARSEVQQRIGEEYLPEKPRRYRARTARAQEAHEAIRPAGERFQHPDELGNEVDPDGRRLYTLIWQRTLASQMRDAQLERTRVLVEAAAGADGTAVFQANGQVVLFDGFLQVHGAGERDDDRILPDLKDGSSLKVCDVEPTDHETRPPDRWTEASLIRELERLDIGRPSTYATILETIQDKYVARKGAALVPGWHAFAVIQLMTSHFSELADAGFTARMEDGLDRVAAGELDPLPWLSAFYFGAEGAVANGDETMLRDGLHHRVDSSLEAIDARTICTIPLAGSNGSQVAVRIGRYGPFIEAPDGDTRAPVPDDVEPDQLTADVAAELLQQAARVDQPLGTDPASGLPIFLKQGRRGAYLQRGSGQTGSGSTGRKRPQTTSVWPTIAPESITLAQALELLSYPKSLGANPESGEDVTVQDGPYGPYVKCGGESRSLPGHGDARYAKLASIEMAEALELLRAPRPTRRGRAQPAPLAELGTHPTSHATITLRDGNYGPYVTDGKLNASIPKDRDPSSITLTEAVELLAARAERVATGAGGRRGRSGSRRRA